MSASPYLHNCNELGVCQDRLHRCTDCKPSVPVIRMINSRRVHTLDEPVPFQQARAPEAKPIGDDAPITRRSRPEPPRPSEPMERCTPEHRLTGWFWFLFGAGVSVLLSGLVLYAK
jgi:hypothetical protein